MNEACKAAGLDGPNINKLPVFVQLGLAQTGHYESANRIKQIGSEPEFRAYRWAPGRTLASERRKKSILHQTACFLGACGHLRCEATII